MQRTSLASTAIRSAGYDATTSELELEFKSGRIYRYSDVPPGVYDFLLRTKEKGSYVNRMITGRYAFRDVSPQAPEQDLAAALRASLGGATEEE